MEVETLSVRHDVSVSILREKWSNKNRTSKNEGANLSRIVFLSSNQQYEEFKKQDV
jgi:hypothetical protein